MFWVYLVLALLAGILFGIFYFGGLWWTVQKITGSEKAYLISVASFVVRTAVVLAGFYLLLMSGSPYLFAALAGFLVARTIITYKLKPGAACKVSS